MSNSFSINNDNAVLSPIFLFYQDKAKSDSMFKKEYDFLPQESCINFFIENCNNFDKLNDKFNELRRKEIEKSITKVEKDFLYDVIEKRILEFPNPYLPKDYKKGTKLVEKYLQIERKFDQKYKKNIISRFFNAISSWLS